jgi:hypothetical protein
MQLEAGWLLMYLIEVQNSNGHWDFWDSWNNLEYAREACWETATMCNWNVRVIKYVDGNYVVLYECLRDFGFSHRSNKKVDWKQSGF